MEIKKAILTQTYCLYQDSLTGKALDNIKSLLLSVLLLFGHCPPRIFQKFEGLACL